MAVVTLLNRTSVDLDATTKAYTSPVFALDPLASDLEVRLRRPTTVSPLAWTNLATVRVSIVYEVDGKPYRSTSRFTGGIRSGRVGEVPECIKRSGIMVQARRDGTKQPFVAVDPKDGRSKNWLELTRLGETATSTFEAYVEIELLSGLAATLDLLSVTMITEAAPTIQFHQSVAFDSAIDGQDTSGAVPVEIHAVIPPSNAAGLMVELIDRLNMTTSALLDPGVTSPAVCTVLSPVAKLPVEAVESCGVPVESPVKCATPIDPLALALSVTEIRVEAELI